MSLFRSLSIVLAVALPLLCRAQIVLVGLPHSENKKTTLPSAARTKALELPLWEDFSSTTTTFANPDIWFAGESIRVNTGMAIRPPSIGVATFDGVDSTGNPYNLGDVLAKGYADKLESQKIDLASVDPSLRNTVYLSYAYQMRGRGELPDEGDRLLVSFKDENNSWIPVDTIENNGQLLRDVFYTSVIQISDEKYFHQDFKFRIQNFSRLSGPYDTWNVDYIYLNKGRTANDLDFPDRTVSEPLTSLFGLYHIMPVKHFQKDTTKSYPSLLATNLLKIIPRPNPNPGLPPPESEQPISVSTTTRITYRENKTIVKMPPVQLEDSVQYDTALRKGQYRVVRAKVLPNLAPLSFKADSIGIVFEMGLSTGDNVVLAEKTGDYIPAKWSPIDFRHNDTTRASFLLLNKYAYDDGEAEYGAGLNQPGAQVAYEFNLVGVSEALISHLEMYFPKFGDESSQVIELRIWNDLKEEPVYKEVTALQRSQQNQFWVKLIKATPVNKKFYIGWKQNTAAIIAAGLDKNSDTGTKMFYNTNGEWFPNTLIHGNLMLRPIFGEGATRDTTGLEHEKQLVVYPNPSTGSFTFGGIAERVVVYDMTGRAVGFHFETTREETVITLPNASQGLYIIRAYIDNVVRTAKVVIRE